MKHKSLVSNCTEKTIGEVVRIERREETSTETDEDGQTREVINISYYPVFEYIAYESSIQQVSSTGTGRPRFSQGQKVTIMYNPADTKQFYVLEDKAAKNFGIYFMVFGLVVVLIGIILLLVPINMA